MDILPLFITLPIVIFTHYARLALPITTVEDETYVFDKALIDEVEILKDAAYVTEGAKEVFDDSPPTDEV